MRALGYLFVFTFGLAIASCGSDSEKVSKKQKDNEVATASLTTNQLLDSLRKPAPTYSINPLRDTVLTCEKGTLIYFPANSLEFEDGTSPNTNVELSVTECYSLADIIMSDLSTHSNEALLETGGMVNLNATSDNRTLQIKKGKEYVICFPKENPKPGMKLFYGSADNAHGVNWIPQDESECKPKTSDNQNTDANGAVTPVVPTQTCKLRITTFLSAFGYKDVKWKFKNSDETLHTYFDKNFNAPDAMVKEFCDDNNSARIEFSLDKSGKVTKLNVLMGKESSYRSFIVSFINSLPEFDITTMGAHTISYTYYFIIGNSSSVDYAEVKQSFEKKHKSAWDKTLEKVDASELNYYVFAATKMGWINCDRFWETKEEKIDYLVKTTSPADTKVKLVFKDINCIMDGTAADNGIVFKNVPVNQSVKIIGIGCKNGKPSMAKSSAVISKSGYSLSGFKEFTLAQLEKELNSVD